MAVPIYILTSGTQGFPLLPILASTCYLFFLIIAILTSMRWYHCGFDLHFALIFSDVEHLFMCLLAPCMSSWEKCLFMSCAHFLIKLFFMLIVWFLCVCVCVFSKAAPVAYGGSQARGLIRAVAASLCHSHSNAGSEPRLQPTPQLTATPDP